MTPRYTKDEWVYLGRLGLQVAVCVPIGCAIVAKRKLNEARDKVFPR